MSGAASKLAVPLVFLSLPLLAQSAERWKIQYSYQKLDSSLQLRDIRCPSAQRCIAAGEIFEKNGRQQGVVVVTSDGGKQWSISDVKERPVSLFFLNDSVGWMVTDRGIWSTVESGRTWTKLEGAKGAVRVHFLDPTHGYAIGYPKAVYETTDGGKKWTKLVAAEQPPTEAQETVYDCIAFSGDHGVIVGNLIQKDNGGAPIWLDPEARSRRERQTKVAILETFDGGKKWAGSTLPVVGTLSELKFANDGSAIILVEYTNYFTLPSSVYKTRLTREGAQTIFEERDRAVTDVALLPDGTAILASIETPGNSNQVPIPGKLKMFVSGNWKVWREMDIDYRAIAQRAILAVVDAQHSWLATDTGMILNLVDSAIGAR
ncbi:MAG TPA: YCF48-related protein [Bryobacteraceae bacterium]|nr:YCF48-related protein [Bryobacteraceae bacterium]